MYMFLAMNIVIMFYATKVGVGVGEYLNNAGLHTAGGPCVVRRLANSRQTSSG